MIATIHALVILLKYYFDLYKKRKYFNESPHMEHTKAVVLDEAAIEAKIKFDPPLFRQRYAAVQQVLLNISTKMDVRKVVEFGCADLNFFVFAKRFQRMEEIIEVDVDLELLLEKTYKLRPSVSDYIDRRTTPLTVQLLVGSVGDPDKHLVGVDAVVAIELIEHLYPDVLDALPYNVFGFIKPKVVVFTTPNFEFNVLFGNSNKFRHNDHKFEWTREQFESWSRNLVSRFPDYFVSFQGLGEGPEGSSRLGCCSQMAVFQKCQFNSFNDDTTVRESKLESFGVCTYSSRTALFHKSLNIFSSLNNDEKTKDGIEDGSYYRLLERIEYPYHIDNRSTEEKILDEMRYKMSLINYVHSRFFNEDQDRFEVPIAELISNHHTQYTTIEEASKILIDANYRLEECIIFGDPQMCVVYPLEMESSGTPSSHNDSAANDDVSVHDVTPDWEGSAWSDWDDTSINDFNNVDRNGAFESARDAVEYIVNNMDVSNLPYDSGYYKSNSNSTSNLSLDVIEEEGIDDTTRPNGGDNFQSFNSKKQALEVNLHSKVASKSGADRSGLACFPGTSTPKRRRKSKQNNGEEDDGSPSSSVKISFNEEEPINVTADNISFINNNTQNTQTSMANIIDNYTTALQSHLLQDSNRNRMDIAIETVEVGQEGLNFATEHNIELEDEFNSREALFDENSQVDLLEEFHIDGQHYEETDEIPQLLYHPIDIPNNEDIVEDGQDPAVREHNEPHFYCQGDGLGVHPSFIEGEEDDDEDEDEDYEDDTTDLGSGSHNLTIAVAEPLPSISEQDVGSLSDDISEIRQEQEISASSENTFLESTLFNTALSFAQASSSGTESSDEYFDATTNKSEIAQNDDNNCR